MARTTTSPEFRPTRILHRDAVRRGALPRRSVFTRFLHPERRVARPHGVVLVGERGAEERHDPVAHHLVDGALVAVDGLHHVLEDRIKELPRLLGVAVGEQLHGALEVGEEHRDLLALALQGGLRGQDLLGEVLGGVGLGERTVPVRGSQLPGRAPHSGRTWRQRGADVPQCAQAACQRGAALQAELRCGGFSCWHRGHCILEPPSA